MRPVKTIIRVNITRIYFFSFFSVNQISKKTVDPYRSRTFHENPEDVPEDGDGGAEDEDGKQERADGICDFVLGLKDKRKKMRLKEACERFSEETSDGVFHSHEVIKRSGQEKKKRQHFA